MYALLTVTLALLGAGVSGWALRRRLPRRGVPRAGSRRGTRTAFAVGAVLLLIPDVLAATVVGAPTHTGIASGVWFVLGMLYRCAVILAFGVGALILVLMSERVLSPVRAARERVVLHWPDAAGREARRLRRTEAGRHLPREHTAMVRYEKALASQLLHYQRDPEAAYNRPAMVDLSDPVTAHAFATLFEAEGLRSVARPNGRDVLTSDYGRSVMRLASAVQAAERNADEQVAAGLDDDERRTLADASRVLAFLSSSAAGPGERQAAYDELIARLSAARPKTPGAASAHRVHPWLEVTERAGA